MNKICNFGQRMSPLHVFGKMVNSSLQTSYFTESYFLPGAPKSFIFSPHYSNKPLKFLINNYFEYWFCSVHVSSSSI